MLLTDWFSLLAICLMGAMFPGASLAVVLRNTLNHSRLHGMVTGISHALGIGLYALLSVLGLVLLLQQSPLLVKAISYAGAVYLLWLGYQGLIAKAHTGRHAAIQTHQTTLLDAARDGLLMALLNPKVGLFFLALFSQFVQENMSFAAKAVFVSTITLVDGGWYVLVASVLSRSRLLDTLRQQQVWVERILGGILILLALKILLGNGY
ncbi:MAG TPA: LysE family translocator [Candidatus Thiothrix moscowensis]|uniref:LysE family translocator n=1 Tax=unclassified Thiothrix TaxID=2636184 RepID=UPI0025DCFC06|nr:MULTISPECIES: LysE family translocator [unclassified Thiothrix]HRJ53991.1 LysE family translocator [Candidatus Thiothrix moscowensis]HRJ94073.1 LysE family translocator [Candidatus Thiothrix moscowensis]